MPANLFETNSKRKIYKIKIGFLEIRSKDYHGETKSVPSVLPLISSIFFCCCGCCHGARKEGISPQHEAQQLRQESEIARRLPGLSDESKLVVDYGQ